MNSVQFGEAIVIRNGKILYMDLHRACANSYMDGAVIQWTPYYGFNTYTDINECEFCIFPTEDNENTERTLQN